jgi:lipopolysaccharide/colanic/teichoic acid biosynthesis glycosyltransferase
MKGFLDEAFFMYGEDLDWCYRIGKAGWKVRYCPNTQIVHFKGESSKRARFDALRTFYHAMELFAEKHIKNKYFLVPYWLLWIAIWLRAGASYLSSLFSYVSAPLLDFTLILGSLSLSFFFRFGSFADYSRFFPVAVAYSIIWLVSLALLSCYGKHRFSCSRAVFAILTGFFINSSLTFFFKQYAFSRAVILLGGTFSLLAIPGWRLVVKLLSSSGVIPFRGTLGKTLLGRNTVIVSDVHSGEKLVRRFNSQVDSGYNIIGIVTSNGEYKSDEYAGVKILGHIDILDSVVKEYNIQEVILSTNELSYDQILRIMSQSERHRVNFKLIPNNLDVIIGKASIDKIDDVPMFEIGDKLHNRMYRFLKRLFDFTLSLFLLLMMLPVMFTKLFIQKKRLAKRAICGLNGTKVEVQQFSGDNSKLGRLPYLWSVCKGDVSFVGSEIIPYELSNKAETGDYHELKPGLTGLIQINRNDKLSVEDKKRFQLYYLRNYSPLLDVEILLKALFKL